MIYLGLDYGARHLGVAIAAGSLAEPLVTLHTENALSSLRELVKKNRITGIVIGDSTPKFLLQLNSLGLPIYQVDETLTTKDAQKFLLHTTPTRRKRLEHAVSAALILQSWIDSQ